MDQGIQHSGGASFAKNPDYFDAGNIVKLALEGGCNAVASTFGVLGAVSRQYAHRIPFIVKINHNKLVTYPKKFIYDPYQTTHRWGLLPPSDVRVKSTIAAIESGLMSDGLVLRYHTGQTRDGLPPGEGAFLA